MIFTIRSATAEDAPAIAALNNRIWPDLPTTADRAAKALTDLNHVCIVAVNDGQIMGFVDGFITFDSQIPSGRFRWEVDLMAVAPEARGNHLAARMIMASDKEGWRFSAVSARAVVRVGNTGAERSFEACGYTPSIPHQLMVAEPEPDNLIGLAVPSSWLFVTTLTYTGLWIEPPYMLVKGARGPAYRQGCDTVGLLIPETDSLKIKDVTALGFEPVNAYRLWTRKL